MKGVTYFQFKCSICESYISENHEDTIVENREEEENLLFGKIITVHVGHRQDEMLHWNIVTLDHNGEYRGHKHSFKEKVKPEVEYYNFSIMAKYAHKFLSKIISDVMSGQNIAIKSQDQVLINLVELALKQFVIPNQAENLFANQIFKLTDSSITNEACLFDIEKKKYHRLKNLQEYIWVEVLLDRLNNIDNAGINHIINSYTESIRKGYYELMMRLEPYFSISEACPLSDPSSTVQVQLFMGNIIPTKEFEKFKAYCTKEEYEIIIALITRQFLLHYS